MSQKGEMCQESDTDKNVSGKVPRKEKSELLQDKEKLAKSLLKKKMACNKTK